MGCVFFEALTGRVLFPEQSNIQTKSFKPDLRPLENSKHISNWDAILAAKLIRAMTERDPDKRPSMSCVLEHPFFWDELKIEKFFNLANGRILGLVYKADRDSRNTISKFKKNCTLNGNWVETLDRQNPIWHNLESFAKRSNSGYDENCSISLMRAARNAVS
jgi:serine/threonine protein kinase